MNRRFANMMLVLCGFGAIVCPALAAANRPFKSSGTGATAFNSPTTATFTMSGTATHLGRMTVIGDLTIQPTPPTIAYSGHATFEAANGDQLEAVIVDGELDPATGVGVDTWQIIGGTGRFRNASGNFAGWCLHYPDRTFDFVLKGDISY